MDNMHDEPQPPALTARPFSTPHSAPVEWLGAGDDTDGPACPEPGPTLSDTELDALAAIARRDPNALAEAIARAAPDDARSDGWGPFARRLFLQVLSETGRVSTACDYTGLTRQSAYALRARDTLFAAGWDAACLIARNALADALYEQAVDGVTDTIEKDGKVVAVRRRFDARLSTAVLARLDKRCDRAEEVGTTHFALMRRWNDWLLAIGAGDDAAATALLDPAQDAPHCQTCQLPESDNPTEEPDEPRDLSARCWFDERDEVWMTDFPPPAGFTGFESCDYGDPNECYERACTPEEEAILEADDAADLAAVRAENEQLRDAWFALLRAELSEAELPDAISDRHPGLDPGPACLEMEFVTPPAPPEAAEIPNPPPSHATSDCHDE